VEPFVLECLKLGLVPGCFVVLLVVLLKNAEHLRVRLEGREDALLQAYKDNVAASAKLAQVLDKRPCLKDAEYGN